MRLGVLFQCFALPGLFWNDSGEGRVDTTSYCQEGWNPSYQGSLCLHLQEESPYYCWVEVGLLASQEGYADNTLASRVKGALLLPLCIFHLHHGVRGSLIITNKGESSSSPLEFLRHHPVRKGGRYFVTIRGEWKSRLPMWPPLTPWIWGLAIAPWKWKSRLATGSSWTSLQQGSWSISLQPGEGKV